MVLVLIKYDPFNSVISWHHLIVWHLAESRRSAIDALLKAAGYLDCAIQEVLPQIPVEVRLNIHDSSSTFNVLLT